MKKYITYTVEDFVTDNHFRKWILRGGTVKEFWEFFLADSPKKIQDLQQAAELIHLLQFKKSIPTPNTNIEVELEKTLHKIEQPTIYWMRHSMWKYAATIALFLFISSLLYVATFSNKTVHTTEFGEQEEIKLPDGSKVILNANSSISYSQEWGTTTRIVALRGEAFFEVVHQDNENPFIVEAGTFDVEVTGTRFNVINRPSKHQVVLEEGKIDVHLVENIPDYSSPSLSTSQLEEITHTGILQLKPNQLFETFLEENENQLVYKKVNSENYTAWLQQKFVCDRLPMRDLALFIENHYGWQVTIEEPHLQEQQVNGTIPTDNIKVILQALPLLLNVEMHIDEQSKEIIFTSNPS